MDIIMIPTYINIERNDKMNSYNKLSCDLKKNIINDINGNILTYKEILSKYEISLYTYTMIKKEYNLQRKITVRKKNNIIDDNYFETIDTEHKAYWLGFLYADGNVNKSGNYHTIIIVLSSIDKNHLYKFKNDLKTTYNVKEYTAKAGNLFCKIECCSKKMYMDLIKLGCIERKTLLLNFPTEDKVPKKLISHFMRGYFDGDGTINNHKEINNKRNQVRFQILGTESFLKGYINNLPLSDDVKENITFQKTKNIKTIQLCGNIQSKKIFDFLYQDATIYLDRKFEKYIQYFYR